MGVEQDIIRWLASDNGFVVQITVFVLLILGGFGFPIPEDLPILLGGVAASKEIVSFHIIFLICYLGVMVGDQIMFFVGHHFGQRLLEAGTKSPFFPSITEDKVNEVREGLRKRRLLYIFIGRHLFPIRSVTFITAGALRIPFFEFFLADAIAAFVSVSLMIWLGTILGQSLTPEMISHVAKQAHYYVIGLVAIICLMYLLNRQIRRVFRKEDTTKSTIVDLPSEGEASEIRLSDSIPKEVNNLEEARTFKSER